MMEFDGERKDPLRSLMKMLKGRIPEYEPHCPIPPDVLEQWNGLMAEIYKAESIMKVAEARKTLFWASLEDRLGIYDKSLSIDVESGMIMIEKPKSSSPETGDGEDD